MSPDEILSFAQSKEGLRQAKEFLDSAQRLDKMIALKLSRLEQLRYRARQITHAPAYSPSGKTGVSDALANAASAAVDLEMEVLSDYRVLMDRQCEIDQIIKDIPDEYQQMVLDMRYLQGLSMIAISMRLSYDVRTIQRIHEKALFQVSLRLAQR